LITLLGNSRSELRGLAQHVTLPVGLVSSTATPAYMSPEQTGQMNRDVDYRSDLYSLGNPLLPTNPSYPPDSPNPLTLLTGVVLYELLCGKRPFVQSSVKVLTLLPLLPLQPKRNVT
jgi:serine/threonine protein kinase